MNKKLISEQTKIYVEQLEKFGDSPQGTHNQHTNIQKLRFERLLKNLDLTNQCTLHDVGCGICDLYFFIEKAYPNVVYSGTDIIPQMQKLVAKKMPQITYYLRDILTVDSPETYDYLTVSGLFNLPGKTTSNEWKDFSEKMITKLYQMCNKGISFNFLSRKAEYFREDMFYVAPEEVFSFCTKNLSRHVIIDHAYPLFEFTVTVLKPDFLRQYYPQPELSRYVKT